VERKENELTMLRWLSCVCVCVCVWVCVCFTLKRIGPSNDKCETEGGEGNIEYMAIAEKE
jgi:hypothetical protein